MSAIATRVAIVTFAAQFSALEGAWDGSDAHQLPCELLTEVALSHQRHAGYKEITEWRSGTL